MAKFDVLVESQLPFERSEFIDDLLFVLFYFVLNIIFK
jgi:hypothetical protein